MKRRRFIEITSKGIIMSTMTSAFFMQPNTSIADSKKNVLLENDSNAWVNYFVEFTKTYQKYENNIYKRELECLKLQLPQQACKIMPHDLWAGRVVQLPIGFTPQSDSGSLGYYINTEKINLLLADPALTSENHKILTHLKEYWVKEDTRVKVRNAYPEEMKTALPSDNWNGESGIAFPLYRMGGIYLDIKKLVKIGLPELKQQVFKKLASSNGATKDLLQSMVETIDAMAKLCIQFAEMAARDAQQTNNLKRRPELLEMEKRLRKIAFNKPETFKEAIQLAFLYTQFSGTNNYGRYDDVFGEFYVNDLKSGKLTEEEALRYTESLFDMIHDRGNIFDSRIILGGKGRENEMAADQYALVLMQAQLNLKNVTPQFSLRFYEGQNPELWNKALDLIGNGCTYPILYNDDVNIPAVMKAFHLPHDEAQHYTPYGCGEYVLNHRSLGTPSGVINLLQALLVTLNKGVDPTTSAKMGIKEGLKTPFTTFDELWNSYKMQVDYHVEQLAKQEDLEYKIAGETAPFLLYSMLFDDCIERKKPIFAGGARYTGGTLETYGNTNTADSLTAIKKLVFEEKKFTLDELGKMLENNFKGFEKERKWMLESPKFGNDDEDADNMLVKVDHHIFNITRDQKNNTDLHSYLVVNINNNANTVMGRYTAASPDGRKANTYMANGNAPTGGMDQNGITALLNSMVKPDPGLHAGMVQNLKFSKSVFNGQRPLADSLLKTYFKKGGTQAMINVMGREDLELALVEPEKYSNLIVRVGGYSAKFVELPEDIQQEVLSRTLY